MPENISLTTEVGLSTTALVIDRTGGFVSSLVDSLLSRGFTVYYFGVEPEINFAYLSHKKTFVYLPELLEENFLEKIDYVYYFPNNDLADLRKIFIINNKYFPRISVGVNYNFPLSSELESLSSSKDFVFKLIFFKDIFGPRVVNSFLGKIFSAILSAQVIEIEKKPSDLVTPLYSETLIKELLKVSFIPLGKGKTYLFKAEEISFQELIANLKNIYPQKEFIFKDDYFLTEKNFTPKAGKSILIRENLSYKIEETAEWFERRVPREKNQEKTEEKPSDITLGKLPQEPKPLNPRFSLEIVEETKENPLEVLFAEKEQKGVVEENNQSNESSSETPENLVENYWQEKKHNSKWGKKGLFFILLFSLLIFCFFALPLLTVLVSGITGMDNLRQTKLSLEKGEFEQSMKFNQKADKFLVVSQKTLNLASPFYSLIGLGKQTKSIASSISFANQVNQSLKVFLQTFEKITQTGTDFINGEGVDWLETQRIIKTNYAYAYQQASLAQSSLKEAEEGFSYFKKKEVFDLTSSYLADYREKLLKGQSLSVFLPEIVGLNSRKTYLILFQNNLELRPTGGFISAFGLVSLENGKLINFEVHDIYEADSQLKGQIEPPQKINEILGEKVWYFRDANFDPEFTASAQKALWFLDKEMNVTADGVIAVNLQILQKTLEVLGETSVPGYDEKISFENLSQKVIQYSETSSFKKENKKEFLVSLIETIFSEVKKAEKEKIIKLEGVIFNQLETNEALLFSQDLNVQSQINELGWGGGLKQYQKKIEGYSIFSDYLYLNEANLGVNKVNYFMDRKTDHQIDISNQGVVKEKLSLIYENKSPSENWPAGSYKNYLRVYLPYGIKLISALRTDPLNKDIWAPFNDDQIEIFDQSGKTVLGLFFEVPAGQKTKLEINYELGEKLDLTAKINSYLLMVQKQPGIYSQDYNLIVSFPQNLVPLRVIPKAVVGEGKLLINEKLTQDKILQIDLAI